MEHGVKNIAELGISDCGLKSEEKKLATDTHRQKQTRKLRATRSGLVG